MKKLYLEEVLQKYPSNPMENIRKSLTREIEQSPWKLIVLDDDPTGIQTVHDVAVYTGWDDESLGCALKEPAKVVYILTDSRGFTEKKTRMVHREIAERTLELSGKLGIPCMLFSRGDSTLRGHYPLETETIRNVMEEHGNEIHGEILCPFFKEGGRYTIDNIHYVAYASEEGKLLTPVGETEFAQDKTFGYQSSDLRQYIEEKTLGKWKCEDVLEVSLEELREQRVDEIVKKLLSMKGFQKMVVNALDYEDLEVFALACYRAMQAGKRFLFRCGASLVKVMGGISDKPLLSRDELSGESSGNGGIIVVGSHTQKTTAQLEQLHDIPGLVFIEFNSDYVLEKDKFEKEIQRVTDLNNRLISEGTTVVNYTKRKVLTLAGDTKEQALLRSKEISNAVQSLVGNLKVKPAFVVAKGGITSSDVGTKALKVRRATVMGQIQPGVPVWKTGAESRFPGIPYIIFPGNVGEKDTMKKAVSVLIGNK